MKKLKVLSWVAAVAAMFSLTSCLDGGGNSSSGFALGYATFSTDAAGIVVKDDFGSVVASPTFNSQLTGGEYVAYAYSVDWDAQVSNKYVNAAVSAVQKFPEIYTGMSVRDTTMLLDQEMPVLRLEVQLYTNEIAFTANNHMFMSVVHKDVATDMKTQYDFSYDNMAEPINVDGKRVYEFYLRAVKVADGDKVKSDTAFTGAYDLSQFLSNARRVEKAAGYDKVNIRVHFISEVGKDYASSKKSVSNVISFAIPSESTSK